MFAFKFQVHTKSVLVKTKFFNRQAVISINKLFKVLSLAWHILSRGCQWSMALSMMLCLNSVQTDI